MFLPPFEINRQLSVTDIVAKDYRTADVFRKYGIGFCCGGKWPMQIACDMRGVDVEKVQHDLEAAVRVVPVSNQLDFAGWSVDFLIDYIINVHHRYLQKMLPETQQILSDFTKEHSKKFPWLITLVERFDLLIKQLDRCMHREEEVLFPYIRQIAHAHNGREPYAALLVRTLRKPVEDTMYKGHDTVQDIILSIRDITSNYFTPENVCISHKVVLSKLRELDNDLAQHLYLEQSILFPRAVDIEKEVLNF